MSGVAAKNTLDPSFDERRKGNRKGTAYPCLIMDRDFGEKLEGEIVNISFDGLGMKTDHKLQVNGLVDITIPAISNLTVRGVIQWSSKNKEDGNFLSGIALVSDPTRLLSLV